MFVVLEVCPGTCVVPSRSVSSCLSGQVLEKLATLVDVSSEEGLLASKTELTSLIGSKMPKAFSRSSWCPAGLVFCILGCGPARA